MSVLLVRSEGIVQYSYATVAEARAEGIEVTTIADADLFEKLELAGNWIDKATGCFFSLRLLSIDMDGNDKTGIVLPYPIISISKVEIDPEDGTAIIEVPLTDLRIYSGDEYLYEPRIAFKKEVAGDYSKFPYSERNITVTGEFGYLERNETPKLIKKANIRLVVRMLEDMGDEGGYLESIRAGLLKSESTDGHSYSLGEIDRGRREPPTDLMTGDPEIDSILLEYNYEPIIWEAI